ncbi:PP2C family protein-serine/threonine phosphatase [Streptomyces sp. TRM70350]|uniref:PP2C family protein-serine/threonine phosphatase n=1 Tax=Streptomyces sp. TRM70350 TaxID=2856165 RepID=UPI001C47A79F|nr:SpoIIE family protein phosphatase [Streptomyces sp. TRM70350]MBV7695681.1 SpoIIE family protein phosphatase [Streptomyces sp. TRM70350]
MTAAPDIWKISSAADAARARSAVARLTAHAPVLDRARFLTDLTAQLRRCLDEGGAELVLAARNADRLQVDVRPAGRPPRRLTLACPRLPGGEGADSTDLADALLAADKDIAAVLECLEEKDELVRFHREELHETNQGVLALHAELDAGARAQRELLDAERAARAEAEKARRLLTFLADASAAVTASLDHEAILRRLPELLVPEYAGHVDVWLFDDEQVPRGGGRPGAAVTAARTGRPQHAADHPGGLPGVDDLPASVLAPGRPLLCIPLTGHRMLGVLTLTAPGPRFDPDTSVMLVELARRIGTALDHARRYEQHRDIAEALQRAQLTDLPDIEGVTLAARYLPATRGLNIGGDWYDAFPQPDGSLLAVIGDVTGHGLRAAVMMGQLRTALRAYAVEGDGPGRILTRLHHMLGQQQPDLYATAVVARFRPGDPTLVWAAAGHPPLVVREPDGSVRVLDAKPGIMLGVPIPYEFQEHAVDLPPGSTLALYTDGLVERRALGIDPGIERLTEALAALSGTELERDLDASAESLLKPMLHDSERDDDVCMLLCHTTRTPSPVPVPSPRPDRGAVRTDVPDRSLPR